MEKIKPVSNAIYRIIECAPGVAVFKVILLWIIMK